MVGNPIFEDLQIVTPIVEVDLTSPLMEVGALEIGHLLPAGSIGAGIKFRDGGEWVDMVPKADLEAMRACKDEAYYERNRVVALLARMAISLGFTAGRCRTPIEGEPDEWSCVYIDLPTGQVSWHYHDSQHWLFDSLPEIEAAWDGHDTPEKYRRVQGAFPLPARRAVGFDTGRY